MAEQEQQIKERYPTATIVKEAASGAHERQAFDNLCKTLQAGDTLVVCKMDRFCRSAKEGLQYVDLLRDKGVAVHILNMGLLDNSPMGRLVATMLLAFAEFEHDQIIERLATGKAVAKAHGKRTDGRKAIEVPNFEMYLQKQKEGHISVIDACNALGISKSTWYNRVKGVHEPILTKEV